MKTKTYGLLDGKRQRSFKDGRFIEVKLLSVWPHIDENS